MHGRGRNPPFYLVKVGGAGDAFLLLCFFFRFKTGATARDVSTILEKTSSETLTFANHITTSRHFGVFFRFRGLPERLEWPGSVYFTYNP